MKTQITYSVWVLYSHDLGLYLGIGGWLTQTTQDPDKARRFPSEAAAKDHNDTVERQSWTGDIAWETKRLECTAL